MFKRETHRIFTRAEKVRPTSDASKPDWEGGKPFDAEMKRDRLRVFFQDKREMMESKLTRGF